MPSNKLRGFFTPEFFHYHRFYARIKRLGSPFNTGWLDWPPWCVQLEMNFDAAGDEVKAILRPFVNTKNENSYGGFHHS
jgi:hypothetical protein